MPRSLTVPQTLTSFHGRRDLTRECVGLLGNATRILALSGSPGSGKSRLAIEVAREVGLPTCWLDLHEEVHANELEHDLLGVLSGALATTGESRLVVLDGLDRITPTVLSVVDQGRSRWRSAKWLLTARSLPDLEGMRSRRLDGLSPEAARALFLARSQARTPNIARTPEEKWAADRLCTALDQNPLAIEQAAAFAPVFGVGGLQAHLATTIFDGTGEPSRGSPHHESLCAAVAWTWEDLPAELRRTTARWSVFEAPFSSEAACALSGLSQDQADHSAQLLCEANLACRDEHDHLELGFTTRVYAARELDASGASEAVRDEHARWFLSRVRIWARSHGPGWSPVVAARTRAHWRDVQVALVRLAAREPLEVAEGLVGLTPLRTGPVGPTLVEAVVSALPLPQLPEPTRCRVLCLRGEVNARAGRGHAARDDLDQALALARSGAGLQLTCEVDWRRGRALHMLGQPTQAAGLLARIDREVTETDAGPHWPRIPLDRGIVAAALGLRGEAEEHFERAHARAEEDPLTAAAARYESGLLALRAGDIGAAEAPLKAAVEAFSTLGIPAWHALAEVRLSAVHVECGRHEQAWCGYDQALCRLDRVDVPRFLATAWTELGLARLKARDRDPARRAARQAILAAERSRAPVQRVAARVLSVASALVDGRPREARVEMEILRGIGADLPSSLAWQVDLVAAWSAGRMAEHRVPTEFTDRWLIAIAARAGASRDPSSRAGGTMRVAHDGRWFQPPGADVVDLRRKGPARRLVAALVAHQRASTVQGLDATALVAAGWPEQKLDRQTAANRLHVTLAGLRKLGFGPLIERTSGAYRLHPDVQVVEEQ